jgi:hypothetical protein
LNTVINTVSLRDCEFLIKSDTVSFSKGNLPNGAKYIEVTDSTCG